MTDEPKKTSDEAILEILEAQRQNQIYAKRILPIWMKIGIYFLILLSIFTSTLILYNAIKHPSKDIISGFLSLIF